MLYADVNNCIYLFIFRDKKSKIIYTKKEREQQINYDNRI